MMEIKKFVELMTGEFDNKEQFMEMKEAGKSFPYAQHINTVCNDKIKNIPEDFNGIFVVEESYYETDGKRHASPHLFLITDSNAGVILSSYEIPAAWLRPMVCKYLGFLGVELDEAASEKACGVEGIISTPESKVKLCVIPTNEELAIARETLALVK